MQFALRNPEKKILLISTDPAHNVSDAFVQNFNDKPQRVNATAVSLEGGEKRDLCNLYACEVDPSKAMQTELKYFADDIETEEQDGSQASGENKLGEFLEELKSFVSNLPGIDEAMALSSVLNYMPDSEEGSEEAEEGSDIQFDLIVFDTAPTGHTLRLLQLPAILKLGLEKLTSWKTRLASLFSSVTSIFSSTSSLEAQRNQQRKLKILEERMNVWLSSVSFLGDMFKNRKKTQFVSVCNASFLSVYETKRLIQELKVANINCEYVLVNMLMPKLLSKLTTEHTATVKKLLKDLKADTGSKEGSDVDIWEAVGDAVELCSGVSKMQQHYMKILDSEVNDSAGEKEKKVKLIMLPMLGGEIRGVNSLVAFSERLLVVDPKLKMKADISSEDIERKLKLTKIDIAIKDSEMYDYVVDTAPRLMNKDIFKTTAVEQEKQVGMEVEEEEEGEKKEKTMGGLMFESITPEMISLVQGLLLKPGGINELFHHPLVMTLRQENEEVDTFFKDIETNGIFAGLKYLSNKIVMGHLTYVAKEIQAQSQQEPSSSESASANENEIQQEELD